MYRANKKHQQANLISDLDQLTDKARERLESSWAGVFYREFFSRLDESRFAVLYSEQGSRPNVPINVLVGLETLKASFGWSDQELHDEFVFNMQVRYALGYRNLGEGEFELRSLYNFRRRLSQHMQQTGQNLIEQAFEQISDEQLQAFQLKTGSLRMDSSQIASNIRRSCRLQLLVEMLQRVHRMLSSSDQARYAEAFAPYLKGSAGQYLYQLKGQQTEPHLQQVGELIQQLLLELAPEYGQQETYQLLKRLFSDQFEVIEAAPQPPPLAPPEATVSETSTLEPKAQLQAKAGSQISPSSLRSPDDPEATYRKKGYQSYQGYVTNLTETCDPSNPFQLILKLQTAANTTEDSQLLLEALPNLKQRLQFHTLYNDAGFCSPTVDLALQTAGVLQVPSALTGCEPDPERTHLADFQFQFDAQGQLQALLCPHGHQALVSFDPHKNNYRAQLDQDPCPHCRFHKPRTSPVRPKRRLRFSEAQLALAQRRQRCRTYHQTKPRLRAAIEATIGALKRPFPEDKTPVRGKFRVGLMLIGSAAMINIRRIQGYLLSKKQSEPAGSGPNAALWPWAFSLFSRFRRDYPALQLL